MRNPRVQLSPLGGELTVMKTPSGFRYPASGSKLQSATSIAVVEYFES